MLKPCNICKLDFEYLPMIYGTRGIKKIENGVREIFICQECFEKSEADKEADKEAEE